MGLLCCKSATLVAVASLVEHGLWSIDSVVVAHGFSSSVACGIFLIKPMSAALAGRFLTSGPPGKSPEFFFFFNFLFDCTKSLLQHVGI